MKLNFKMIAAAAALVVAAGGAHADIVTQGQSGALALYAFNQVTQAYYIRDLGYTMNTFLPSTVTTSVADGGGSAVTGDKTPVAGLTLDKTTNTANFADTTGSWATFVAGATLSDILWAVSSSDSLGVNAAQGVVRLITTSVNAPAITNGQINNYISTGAAGGLATLFNPTDNGLSAVFASGRPSGMVNNFGLGAGGLTSLDADAGLWYYTRTTSGTAGASIAANEVQFGNGNFALVRLEADGDFSYTLAPAAAVPLPAAAWMMGAGLLGIGGMIRRRRAAAQA